MGLTINEAQLVKMAVQGKPANPLRRGPGVSTLSSSRKSNIVPRVSSEANFAKILIIGRFKK